MAANRVLFVDDEPNLRLTYASILEMHGFEVRTAATVAEALREMTTHTFEILISDLNIGQPGDGFTVVSAMRRTQPECINFIVTGFPAFEHALATIKGQVDEYLVKPAQIEEMVGLIQERLKGGQLHRPEASSRLSRLLSENLAEIRDATVRRMKADSSLASIPMSDEERADRVAELVAEITHQLDSATPEEPTPQAIQLSREHGADRLRAGYRISMLVTEMLILEGVVQDLVRQHLLQMDPSHLLIDLKRFNNSLEMQLRESVQAFWDQALKPRPQAVRRAVG